MYTQLTKHFSIKELFFSDVAFTNDISNVPVSNGSINESDIYDNIFYTCCMLEIIRQHYGRPIRISSGYRCPELNTIVGGSPNSNHMKGLAVDINQGSKTANKKLFLVISNLSRVLPINELINEHDYSWIHVSFNDLKS